MANIPYNPHCEACSRDQEASEGMLSVRQGGMPVWLCFGCIDGFGQIVEAIRRERANNAD